MPVALIVAPCVEIQKSCGAVVTAIDLGDISQIHRAAIRPGCNCDVVELLLILEFAGWIDGNHLLAYSQLASGQRDVASVQNVRKLTALNAVRRQSRLRIEKIDTLIQDAGARNARHL